MVRNLSAVIRHTAGSPAVHDKSRAWSILRAAYLLHARPDRRLVLAVVGPLLDGQALPLLGVLGSHHQQPCACGGSYTVTCQPAMPEEARHRTGQL